MPGTPNGAARFATVLHLDDSVIPKRDAGSGASYDDGRGALVS